MPKIIEFVQTPEILKEIERITGLKIKNAEIKHGKYMKIEFDGDFSITATKRADLNKLVERKGLILK